MVDGVASYVSSRDMCVNEEDTLLRYGIVPLPPLSALRLRQEASMAKKTSSSFPGISIAEYCRRAWPRPIFVCRAAAIQPAAPAGRNGPSAEGVFIVMITIGALPLELEVARWTGLLPIH